MAGSTHIPLVKGVQRENCELERHLMDDFLVKNMLYFLSSLSTCNQERPVAVDSLCA